MRKRAQSYGIFPKEGPGGGAQPYTIAFGGVFTNITATVIFHFFTGF